MTGEEAYWAGLGPSDMQDDEPIQCRVIGCKEPAKMHYDFGWTGPWCDKHFLDTTGGIYL